MEAQETPRIHLYARGASGIYHSVTADKMEAFQKEQRQLEQDGTLMERLRILNEKASLLMKK